MLGDKLHGLLNERSVSGLRVTASLNTPLSRLLTTRLRNPMYFRRVTFWDKLEPVAEITLIWPLDWAFPANSASWDC